jgi:hypothetical protein
MYLANWLALRPPWWALQLSRLNSYQGHTTGISAQHWREALFHFDTIFSTGKHHKHPEKLLKDTKQAQRQGVVETAFCARSIELSNGLPQKLHFFQYEIPSAHIGDIGRQLTGEIMWELYEVNFRFELLALDQAILPVLWEGARQANARMQALRAIFPSSGEDAGFLPAGIPGTNQGLAAERLHDRLPYLCALQGTLVAWQNVLNDTTVLNTPALAADRLTEADVLALEKRMAQFYCQAFFIYFRRGALLPHHLPW